MTGSTITRIESGPQASQVVVHGGIAYVCGIICPDGSLDEYDQAKFVLNRIDTLLTEVGTDKSRLLRGWLFVSDIRYHARADKAWMEWLAGMGTPVRVSAAIELGMPHFKVEIAVDAAV